MLNADDPVAFERVGVRDGDVVEVGAMRVRILHTPGHTHTHLSFAVDEEGGDPVAVFTGGSLLYGATGRPDLLGPDHTDTLAHGQWHSARRLATELPDATEVYPTHGFGSFCSAAQSGGTQSTIGQEKATNPALTVDEARWVDDLLAGLEEYPAYYAHMGQENLAGPDEIDLSPPAEADPAGLRRRIEAGEWVVDLRSGTAFAAGHVVGTINIGLGGQFVTYLGWLLPWGTPVTLLGETADDVADAQRELVRIGIDRPAAMATGKPEAWAGDTPLRSFPQATFDDLAAAMDGGSPPAVLDVRRTAERDTGYIEGSVGIPIHEILDRIQDVPDGPVWVHCAGGYRAAIVAGLLDAHGHDVVAVDDAFTNARPAGLSLVASDAPTSPVGQLG